MLTLFIKYVDKFINPLIWISIILLFIEMSTGTNSSKEGLLLFLLIERVTASIFLIEYFVRWLEDYIHPEGHKDYGYNYPLSIFGFIDLFSWLPFIIGFFVPIQFLGWIRALRILRCFKLFRYSRRLQLYALAMYRAWPLLQPIIVTLFIFGLLAAALIFEAERHTQEDFRNVFNLFYFVATSDSTVGYGDMCPKTDIGRLLTIMLIFIPGIAVFSSLTGIMANALSEVMEMERDPNIDPLEQFNEKANLT